jgi:prevent-host-death family protein
VNEVSDVWPVQDAKARFSEFLERCLEQGPQLVTRRGVQAAVLVRIDEWRRLQAAAQMDLKGILLAEEPRVEFRLPERSARRRRKPPMVD